MILEPQLSPTAAGEERPASPHDRRRTMGVALPVHALHDGYSDLVYILLPIWQAEFALSYAAVGLLRSTLSGTMAAFQIPAGLLAYGVFCAVRFGNFFAYFAPFFAPFPVKVCCNCFIINQIYNSAN